METSEHNELNSLVYVLQQLSNSQLNSILQFIRNDNKSEENINAPTLIASWSNLLQRSTPQQIQQLISIYAMKQNESEYKEQLRRFLEPMVHSIGLVNLKELEISLELLLSIYNLHNLLQELTVLQLIKLFDIMPSGGPPMKQLQLLQQIQQLFAQLQAEALQNLYRQLRQAQPGTENQMLMKILDLPADYFQLYQPLRSLLQLDLEELMKFQNTLPKINASQMLQLLQLLQLQTFDVLELRSLLLGQADDDMALSDAISDHIIPPQQQMLPPQNTGSNQQKKLSLQIVEHPPEKSVYKRNLKPNPVVMIVGDEGFNDNNLFVVAMLYRCDNFTEEPKYMQGNKPMRVASGRLLTFRKLKVLTTSHQQQETLFCIKFELRRYLGEGEDDYELLDGVFTNPISVLSHSTQMKPIAPSNAPSVLEVVPSSGPPSGGTKIAIIGKNFIDNPMLRVRFDTIEVTPSFLGPGTLTCLTPEHHSGTVQVRVCNSLKKWSDTSGKFTYDPTVSYAPLYNNTTTNNQTHTEGIPNNAPIPTNSTGGGGGNC